VVVGADEADEIDFDGEAVKKKKGGFGSDKIRISQTEKWIYDMVDGTMTVGDIVEVSRFSEFDTNKGLYELLTRDLIEEVRGASAAAVLAQATPVDESEVAQTPVPLPLVIVLGALAIAMLVTSLKNPLNGFQPLTGGLSSLGSTRKAISMQRIELVGQGLEKYSSVHGRLPVDIKELAPHYVSPAILHDPWGNAYKYLQPGNRYLVIGFTEDGKPDTDLFLSRSIGAPASITPVTPETGGIFIDD
jgi:hypothetical protein